MKILLIFFEKGQILMPFSGQAPLKLKKARKKIKGRLCVYRGIVCYHLQYGLGGLQDPPPSIMPYASGKSPMLLRVNQCF